MLKNIFNDLLKEFYFIFFILFQKIETNLNILVLYQIFLRISHLSTLSGLIFLSENNLNAESKIDEKGRVIIPIEIRKLLNIKSGEKIIFQVQDDKIILRKSTSIEDFVNKSKIFSEKLKNITKKPIEFKKMLE